MPKGEHPLIRFWSKVDETATCWRWIGATTPRGYGRFWNDGRLELAHHFSWRSMYGQIPRGKWVLHRCDNPSCVNPYHLFLGTPQENTNDMVAKGRARHAQGEGHGARKLTEAQVHQIRELCAAGVSQSEAARQHGVNYRTAHLIVHRKIWKHI